MHLCHEDRSYVEATSLNLHMGSWIKRVLNVSLSNFFCTPPLLQTSVFEFRTEKCRTEDLRGGAFSICLFDPLLNDFTFFTIKLYFYGMASQTFHLFWNFLTFWILLKCCQAHSLSSNCQQGAGSKLRNESAKQQIINLNLGKVRLI